MKTFSNPSALPLLLVLNFLVLVNICGCDLLNTNKGESFQSKNLLGSSATLSTEKTAQDPFDSIFQQMVYIWRDRSSCSGVRIQVPETTPPAEAYLTSGHCISANPIARSRGIDTPRFTIRPISQHKHPRIDSFLADLFFSNETLDYTEYQAEVIDSQKIDGKDPWLFQNSDKMLALYHSDFEKNAFVPVGGVIHRDYFSLLRRVFVNNGEGYNVILQQFDLALIPLLPAPPYTEKNKTPRLISIRPKPVAKPGDKYFALYLGRDNVKRELHRKVEPVEVVGFSPKHGLIQVCESPKKNQKDYTSDRSTVLVIERDLEFYIIGLGSFGSPVEKLIEGKMCSLTSYTHLSDYKGWMKIAYSQLAQEFNLNPSSSNSPQ